MPLLGGGSEEMKHESRKHDRDSLVCLFRLICVFIQQNDTAIYLGSLWLNTNRSQSRFASFTMLI
jgi:hypothetical protein